MVMYKIDRRGGDQKSYTRTDPGFLNKYNFIVFRFFHNLCRRIEKDVAIDRAEWENTMEEDKLNVPRVSLSKAI